MRDLEPRLVDLLVPVEQEVEVDRARSEARPAPIPAEQPLDGLKPVEQPGRRQLRPESGGAVEESRLVLVADRIGLLERRDCDDLDLGPRFEQLEGAANRRFAVSEIGTEPDES